MIARALCPWYFLCRRLSCCSACFPASSAPSVEFAAVWHDVYYRRFQWFEQSPCTPSTSAWNHRSATWRPIRCANSYLCSSIADARAAQCCDWWFSACYLHRMICLIRWWHRSYRRWGSHRMHSNQWFPAHNAGNVPPLPANAAPAISNAIRQNERRISMARGMSRALRKTPSNSANSISLQIFETIQILSNNELIHFASCLHSPLAVDAYDTANEPTCNNWSRTTSNFSICSSMTFWSASSLPNGLKTRNVPMGFSSNFVNKSNTKRSRLSLTILSNLNSVFSSICARMRLSCVLAAFSSFSEMSNKHSSWNAMHSRSTWKGSS